MELSKRLQAVANLVSEGLAIADIGTDHGYIPIHLIKTKKCPSAIAMDVNKGPLLRAESHIEEQGLQSFIQTRLSDGVQSLVPNEVESVVIAGMGGALTIRILEAGEPVIRALKEFVLQPQSEIWKVREFLCKEGYCIIDEDMVLEDGKFYPMMKVINGRAPAYNDIELRYGKCLLEKKHPVLEEFLNAELRKQDMVLENLEIRQGTHIDERRKEILKKREEIRNALQRYYASY